MVKGAHLGMTGTGEAARYRLTDCHYAGQAPTYDFQNWDGVLFPKSAKRVMTEADKERLKARRKKQNPVPTAGTPRPNGRDIRAKAGKAGNGNKRPNGRDIRNVSDRPNGKDITSLNHIPDAPPMYDPETAATVKMLRTQGVSYREINKQLATAGTLPPELKGNWEWTAPVLTDITDELTPEQIRALRLSAGYLKAVA
jgi:hypothetical protein